MTIQFVSPSSALIIEYKVVRWFLATIAWLCVIGWKRGIELADITTKLALEIILDSNGWRSVQM